MVEEREVDGVAGVGGGVFAVFVRGLRVWSAR